jgi:hypothetical protein
VVVHRLEALQIETNKERMASRHATAAAAAAAAGPSGSVDPSETQPLLGVEAGEGNGSVPVDGSDGSGAPASEGQEEGEQEEHEPQQQQQEEEEESEGGTSQQMIKLEAGDGGDGVEAAARSDETDEVSGCCLPACLGWGKGCRAWVVASHVMVHQQEAAAMKAAAEAQVLLDNARRSLSTMQQDANASVTQRVR